MDLEVIETGNGGDLVYKAKDVSVIEGMQSMIYLALFGGNVEESTPQIRPEGTQAFDFWGNRILYNENPDNQFNSETERTLNSIPLTSSGRAKILEAAKKDLAFLSSIAEVVVDVVIDMVDRVRIQIEVNQTAFVYIWDATKRELTLAEEE